MKEPVDHIIRPSLPWRLDIGITECGYDASKVKAITRQEFLQRFKDLGQQRCAMLMCMTCYDTCRRWGTWEDDPRKAVEREIIWEHGGGYRARDDHGTRLRDELLAIAALIEAHRAEFETTIETNTQRREWIAKKVEKASRKPPPVPPRPNSL